MDPLDAMNCVPCEGGIDPLPSDRVARLLNQIPGWRLNHGKNGILRCFPLGSFQQTITFINALAWMSNQQGHHPDFTVSGYDCTVTFTTHAIGGLSENDFICAARLNALARGKES